MNPKGRRLSSNEPLKENKKMKVPINFDSAKEFSPNWSKRSKPPKNPTNFQIKFLKNQEIVNVGIDEDNQKVKGASPTQEKTGWGSILYNIHSLISETEEGERTKQNKWELQKKKNQKNKNGGEASSNRRPQVRQIQSLGSVRSKRRAESKTKKEDVALSKKVQELSDLKNQFQMKQEFPSLTNTPNQLKKFRREAILDAKDSLVLRSKKLSLKQKMTPFKEKIVVSSKKVYPATDLKTVKIDLVQREKFEKEIQDHQQEISKYKKMLMDEQKKTQMFQKTFQNQINILQDQVNKRDLKEKELLSEYHNMVKRYEVKINELKNQKNMDEDLIRVIEEKKMIMEKQAQELKNKSKSIEGFHGLIQKLRGNTRVFCRIKPSTESINSQKNGYISVDPNCEKQVLFAGEKIESSFYFDHIFAPSSTQQEVFENVKDFLTSFLLGEGVCIFTFGQTGSGKTFTMEGDLDFGQNQITERAGIIPRGMHFIIEELKKEKFCLNNKTQIFCQSFEIYNEEIYDILADKPTKIKIIKGRPHKATLKKINSVEDALEIIKICHQKRKTEKTEFNSRSSRSHLVYKIMIFPENGHISRKARILYLVDLAGSEKVVINNKTKSKFESKRQRKIKQEAIHINQSLTTLRRVITEKKLGLKKISGTRESKLTHLIHNCLKGDGQLLMISNISSDSKDKRMTKETLKFSSIQQSESKSL